ncbi:MAG: ATP-dependent DNA helicase [Dehalococcoidales bacterium]|nr:ATP-dependent DNA helicase [Dehalococcoidales bacterium]
MNRGCAGQIALSEPQRAAVTAAPGRLVFMGGPGSGKSLVICERAIWLVANNVARAGEVLVLAPSRRAAVTLDEYIRRRRAGTGAPTATSFHGLALTILRRHYRELGYGQMPQILNAASHFHFLRRILTEEDPVLWPHYGKHLRTKTVQKLVHDVVVKAAENGLDAGEVVRRAHRWGRPDLKELALFYARYQERHRLAGMVDFGELLGIVAQALSARPEIGDVYRRAFRHILVDEYEEANPAQAELLYHLIDAETDLLIAGDPQQAINSYRGGTSSNLLACQEAFGASAIISSENFRSAERLAALDRFVCPAKCHLVLGDERPEGEARELFRRGDVRQDDDETCGAVRNPSASPGLVVLRSFTYLLDEARWIATKVESLIESGTPPTQVAILFRKLAVPLANILSAELAHRGIPCDVQSDRPVLEDRMLRAAVDVLRYLAALEDSAQALVRVLESPLSGLPPFGLRELQQAAALANKGLAQLAAEEANLEDLRLSEATHAATVALRDRLAALRRKVYWSVENLLWDIWRLFPAFRADALAGGRSSAVYATLLAEVSTLQERRGSMDIKQFLDLLESGYFERVSAESRRQQGVVIATVHQAKGREWDVVFLPGLVEGTFPQGPSQLDETSALLARDLASSPDPSQNGIGRLNALLRARHLEEERRVFYVAISRARRDLYLSHSCRNADGTAAEPPSRFLDLVAKCTEVEIAPHDAGESLPSDVDGAAVHYRRLLVSTDPLSQAQALYALHEMRQIWPQSLRSAEWWDNVQETDGAAPPFPDGSLFLSASRLGTYRDCPLKYEFGYHWGLGEPEGPALTIGSLLHKVLEEYHRPGSLLPRTRETLGALLEQNFDEGAFRYRPVARQGKKSLSQMLDAYYSRYGQLESVVEVEKSFEFAFGPHSIAGYVDRVDQLPSGELEIVDYKTGEPMSNAEAEDDLQLAIYDLAFHGDEKLRAIGKPAKVSYLYVKKVTTSSRGEGKRSYSPTDESRARLEGRLARYSAGILGELFPSRRAMSRVLPDLDAEDMKRTLSENPCRHCSFGWICPEMERGDRGS